MAHYLNDHINRLEKQIAVNCNESCEYWMFPHNENACVLSSVFSVNKGMPCYEYKAKEKINAK